MKKFLLFAVIFLLCTFCFSQNVGIGISNPLFKLDVRNGSINTDSLYRIGTISVLAAPGVGNLFVGKDAGRITTGIHNTFSGDQAGYSNTAGFDNSFFGQSAGLANNTGIDNSFFGRYAGYSNTIGSANAFFSGSAGYSNTSGSYNSFFGGATGYSNTIGVDNSFFGLNAGYANISGNSNSFFGRSAGYNTIGDLNSFFGISAGTSNTTGSNNTLLGSFANLSIGTLNNATAIGYRSYVSLDNSLVLGSINGINGATSSSRVGIGTSTPSVPLDVRSTVGNILRLDGGTNMYASFYENGVYRSYIGSYSGNPEDADFGTGSGNTTGKLHLTIQAIPKLTVNATGDVGVGNTAPAYRLDVNGDMNITGAMRVNGSPGTTGQVLTSNGSSDPQWKNAAYSNTTRFSVDLVGPAFTLPYESDNDSANLVVNYNLNPTDISIGSKRITIHKTGLYHIEGCMLTNLQYVFGTPTVTSSHGVFFVDMNFTSLSHKYRLVENKFSETNNLSTLSGDHFSIDIHIVAGQQFRIDYAFFVTPYEFTPGSSSVSGWLNGYLISE